ncbi:hypothetical protein L1987_04865 [Smallanthus sonchifolius]|uniref:Uncharacterized protein n=1 Tax=Smallanthus sonchifolius TaxID=185202 RepID=A0ACB9JU41_9ASTR|nr:hypothetical protein L1987_04865 [Smallanthus sonchifolius]
MCLRVSSLESKDTDPAILLNWEFDSPPGSPGASVCGSCVASILEVARMTIDSWWTPPKPLIFLFNGAKELFMLILSANLGLGIGLHKSMLNQLCILWAIVQHRGKLHVYLLLMMC